MKNVFIFFTYMVSLWLCLFQSHEVLAQNKLKFDHFTTDNGLASNYVDYVYCDSYNYLWIGTYNGLNRYDGYNFKLYKRESDSEGLSRNTVIKLFEDSETDLWIGTINGVSLYERKQDKIHPIRFVAGKEILETAGIAEDRNHNFWFGSYSGLYKYNKYSHRCEHFGANSRLGEMADSMITGMFHQETNHRLWIATNNGGLYCLDLLTETITSYRDLVENRLGSKRLRNVMVDRSGQLWISSFDAGILVYNPSTTQSFVLNMQNSNLGNNHVANLINTSDGRIWACCVNGYLNLYDSVHRRFQIYYPDAEDAYSIKAMSVSHLCEDKKQNYWVGSHGDGLFGAVRKKQYFDYFIQGRDHRTKLNSGKITGFREIDNTLWYSSDGGGIGILDLKTQTIDTLTTGNGLSSNWVLNLTQGSDGLLYAASWQGGVMQINPKTRQIRVLSTKQAAGNKLSLDNVKAVAAYNDVILIGTHGDGVNVYNPRTQHVITSNWKFDLKKQIWINTIFVDSYKRIWIGSQQGLVMFDGVALCDFTNKTNLHATIDDRTYQICEDKNHVIWIASEQGLCYYDEKNKVFCFMNELLNLPLSAKSVLVDNNNNLWVGTNSGLFLVSASRKNSLSFTKNDGLLSNYLMQQSNLLLKNGTIVEGTVDGFNMFNPQKLIETDESPHISLTQLSIDNKEIEADNLLNFSKPIDFADTVFIYPHQTEFSLYYACVSPQATHNYNYAYRLLGFNAQWAYVGKEQKATYTNLDPGTYIFQVASYGVSRTLSPNIKTVTIIILPPWWRTWWFKVLLAIFIIGGFYCIMRLRTKAITRRNAELEKQVKLRTKELNDTNRLLLESYEEIKQQNELLEESNRQIRLQNERITAQQTQILEQNTKLEQNNKQLNELNQTKDKFFSIIAHDLKNPVGALSGISELLHLHIDKYDQEKIRRFVKQIHLSSTAIQNLLLNLLDWARTQSKQYHISIETINLTDLLNEVIALSQQQADAKEISIETSIAESMMIDADYNMMHTVVRNLMSNAIKFTPNGGKVSLVARSQRIEIRDTGVGMDAKTLAHLFQIGHAHSTSGTNHETGTGLGLLICKEFIEANKGQIAVESEVNVGTCFIINLS